MIVVNRSNLRYIHHYAFHIEHAPRRDMKTVLVEAWEDITWHI